MSKHNKIGAAWSITFISTYIAVYATHAGYVPLAVLAWGIAGAALILGTQAIWKDED